MYKEIMVKDLAVGMYVTDTGLPWTEHPHVYCKEGRIDDRDQIESIRSRGYLKVFIDTERGIDVQGRQDKFGTVVKAMVKDTALSNLDRKPGARTPIKEELVQAKRLYSDSIKFAKDFIRSVGFGKDVDYQGAEQVVEDMMQSLSRNHEALVSIGKLRAYDEYTYTHCVNVAVLSLSFAKFINLPDWQLKPLGVAAFLHDIGKARIPKEVLNKPGKLTEAEFEIMKAHPQRSYEVLKDHSKVPPEVLRGIVEHHEKFNGRGYPRGIADNSISMFGRVISLADVFDAISSRRVYKEAMLPHNALKIMYGMREESFDTGMVSSFIKFMGIYPVGSLVKLSSGEFGVVTENNPKKAQLPVVLVTFDPELAPIKPRTVNLAEGNGNALSITACLDHKSLNIDPMISLMN